MRMTIGQKLMLGAAAGMILTLTLCVVTITVIGGLRDEVDLLGNSTGKKLDLAAGAALDAAQLLSTQRGLLARCAVGHMERANLYHRQLQDKAAALEARLERLATLLYLPEGRRAHRDLVAGLKDWREGDAELWKFASQGQMKEALDVWDIRVVPIGERMQEASGRLLDIQRGLLSKAVETAMRRNTQSRWVAFSVLALSMTGGTLMLLVVRRINRSLQVVAGAITVSATEVAATSREVSSLATTLAAGATEQAASLEQTAASAEQISSMTRQNTDRAITAAKLTTEVSGRAAAAHHSLDGMIQAMRDITSSSDKISRIIHVIEEIAFQTNILALNAAVEASRAGEAGLSFGVVADEVRTLAHRCADAVHETEKLILESGAHVKEGDAKLKDVAGAIHAITKSVDEVHSLTEGVTSGSQEQAHGIDNITTSIAQMNQVTQTSAASAEQSAAASKQLETYAATLRDAVDHLDEMLGIAA